MFVTAFIDLNHAADKKKLAFKKQNTCQVRL